MTPAGGGARPRDGSLLAVSGGWSPVAHPAARPAAGHGCTAGSCRPVPLSP
ncbi:hypothetical protein STVIR_5124 [Streptomyces viridochromogenes Tue57]|uniref:Uncharacterized protein n=1 Tax=Streptomyces viridochromogenes Tue57 TaxID=1160705 RepID=L8PBU7_STRVR|nr:hypothetical protein STVIR_5124 [Streptomyces viridochromogenes Tue57]